MYSNLYIDPGEKKDCTSTDSMFSMIKKCVRVRIYVLKQHIHVHDFVIYQWRFLNL